MSAVVVDVRRISNLMKSQGIDMSTLAQNAGLSRQGLYRLLRPEHPPLNRGFQSVATTLGVSALSLMRETRPQDEKWHQVESLLGQAASGESRAFEVLPAHVIGILPARRPRQETLPPSHHQLLAAAGEVARSIVAKRGLKKFTARHAAFSEPGQAFFFAANLMSPDRIVATTPKPMKRHLVFGSFQTEDFERHFT